MMRWYSKTKSIKKCESGAAALEFVIVAPFFFLLFFWILETGFVTFHAIQVDRAVDIVVRDLMVNDITAGMSDDEAHEFLKTKICDEALVADCADSLKLEISPVSITDGALTTEFQCLDRRTAEIDPDYNETFTIDAGACVVGDSAVRPELVYFRACLIVDPILPAGGFSMPWDLDSSGGIQLKSTSAFVNEPC